MPIEFRCSSCNQLLRVADESAGKEAKCPQCGTVMVIPTPTAPPSMAPVAPAWQGPTSAVGQPGTNPFAAENPYRSPAAGMWNESFGPSVIRPTMVGVSEALDHTWAILKSQFGMCFVACIILLVVNFGVSIACEAVLAIMRSNAVAPAVITSLNILRMIATNLLNLWLGIGQSLFFLNVARGRQPNLSDLFSGTPYFLTSFVAALLFGIMMFFGFILLIVPGIIVALMFWPFQYLILDQKLGIIDCLERATELTKGNKLTIFVIWLVMVALAVLAALPCGLGLILYLPFASLLSPVVYLLMSGQPTADQYHLQDRQSTGLR